MSAPNSFAELQKNNYPASTVINVFKSYADTGAAIISEVVIRIIDKTPLNKKQLSELQAHALVGIIYHGKKARFKEAEKNEVAQYAIVYAYLSDKLSQ